MDLIPRLRAPLEETGARSLQAICSSGLRPLTLPSCSAGSGCSCSCMRPHGMQPGAVDMKRWVLARSTSSLAWPPPRDGASVTGVTASGHNTPCQLSRVWTQSMRGPQPLPPAASCHMAADSLAQQYGHDIAVTGGDPEGGNHCAWLHKSYTSPLGVHPLPWQHF